VKSHKIVLIVAEKDEVSEAQFGVPQLRLKSSDRFTGYPTDDGKHHFCIVICELVLMWAGLRSN
jgi:hypothetical protein